MDNNMLHVIHTDLAIEAFRKAEQKRYQLDLTEYALVRAMLTGNLDMTRYYEETEKIRNKFERDREKAAVRGLLPRESSELYQGKS